MSLIKLINKCQKLLSLNNRVPDTTALLNPQFFFIVAESAILKKSNFDFLGLQTFYPK